MLLGDGARSHDLALTAGGLATPGRLRASARRDGRQPAHGSRTLCAATNIQSFLRGGDSDQADDDHGLGDVTGAALAAFLLTEEPTPSAPAALAEAEPATRPPTVLERKELTPNAITKNLILSVREPVTEAEVRALIEPQRRDYFVVRVFTYRADQTAGHDAAHGLWEWRSDDGTLKKKYSAAGLIPCLQLFCWYSFSGSPTVTAVGGALHSAFPSCTPSANMA